MTRATTVWPGLEPSRMRRLFYKEVSMVDAANKRVAIMREFDITPQCFAPLVWSRVKRILDALTITREELAKARACSCGNPAFGFDCTCDWSREHPGDTHYACEFCGIYVAGKPHCNYCEGTEGDGQ
jgi:hypothetical protein